MSRRLLLRRFVPDDLENTVDHLRAGSPEAAVRFLDAYEAAIAEVVAHPGRGSQKLFGDPRVQGFRSWQIPGFAKHLIIYRYTDDAVIVIAVTHGGRDIEQLLLDRVQ